jgi:hypothetical protein
VRQKPIVIGERVDCGRENKKRTAGILSNDLVVGDIIENLETVAESRKI